MSNQSEKENRLTIRDDDEKVGALVMHSGRSKDNRGITVYRIDAKGAGQG